MKRKRQSIDDPQICDLILTDANGRSIRVNKALLMDKSGYFARLLSENHLQELQLNENYLVELIRYLYNHEAEEVNQHRLSNEGAANRWECDEDTGSMNTDASITNGDLEILMHLLAMSKKYAFTQLYNNLMVEINYKLGPNSILTIYRCARDLAIEEWFNSTRLMILSWLPQLQQTEEFHRLSEESINHIFTAESPSIDNECKLNALSSWWSHNKEANITDLWFRLSTCIDR